VWEMHFLTCDPDLWPFNPYTKLTFSYHSFLSYAADKQTENRHIDRQTDGAKQTTDTVKYYYYCSCCYWCQSQKPTNINTNCPCCWLRMFSSEKQVLMWPKTYSALCQKQMTMDSGLQNVFRFFPVSFQFGKLLD